MISTSGVFLCFLAVANSRNIQWLSSNRIVGGHDATPGQFPHQISMQVAFPPLIPVQHFCGGSILSDRWILTAAHCAEVHEQFPFFVQFFIKAGKHNLSQIEPTEQISFIESYHKHEKYIGNGQVGPYDIALLKLRTPLTLNDRVAVAQLPEKDSEPTGDVDASGWGTISNDTKKQTMPDTLQTVTVPIVERKQCNAAIKKLEADEGETVDDEKDLVDETNICTGPLSGGISVCSGDSGGPLSVKGKDNQTEVIGVASWAVFPCGREGAPAVFGRVSSFVDWINDVMAKN
ncbi:hypothetical protein QAD02_000948 [Eretmocerus hayati]|uniref:Uncharacterized protein n=1 Tax=Eretmocerus hayati TaxID=131215 RepID=A0ACC2NF28_9HYME|nr:hypothetical protein QAD02_000948 [Eretmocerus hayati]